MARSARRRRAEVYLPLVWLCLAGAVLRAVVMVTYSSAVFVFQSGDSIRYARIAAPGYSSSLFSDPFAPAGYPAFLKLLRAVWPALPLTVGVQHALGLGLAVLLYLVVRRLGTPPAGSLLPAAAVLLGGDELFLEHALLSETLWALLITAGLLALLAGAERDDMRLLTAGGALLAGSSLVRQISLPLLALAAVYVLLSARETRRGRVLAAAGTVGGALLILGLYGAVVRAEHGIGGLAGRSGFQLYGRVAPFADCSAFRPPTGTRSLCQSTPPAARPGPIAQLYDPSLPLVARFGYSGRRDALLRRFALTAIQAQPGAYAHAVLSDWATAAGFDHERPGAGATPTMMRFSRRSVYGGPAPTSTGIAAYYQRAYTAVRAEPRPHWAARLGGYQSIVRLHEILVLPLVLVALAGIACVRGPIRSGLGLVLGSALALYLLPAIANFWDVRYGVLPGELLVAAATAGGWQTMSAIRARRAG